MLNILTLVIMKWRGGSHMDIKQRIEKEGVRMTKCDLQTGMRVQLRNCARYVVLKDVEKWVEVKDE